jgi:Trypsin.
MGHFKPSDYPFTLFFLIIVVRFKNKSMERISEKIRNKLLQLKIRSVKKAVDYFQSHVDDFLPESRDRIESIIANDLKEKELLLRIINHDFLRPAIIVQEDSFSIAADNPWEPILKLYKKQIQRAIKSTGIFEVQKRLSKYPAGTGWVVTDDLVVTNQHVAEQLFEKKNGQYVFKKGKEQLTIDFKEEFDRVDDQEFKILELVHMEDSDHHLYDHVPDLAILRVEKVNANGDVLPPPLPLFEGPLKKKQLICIIGFPSIDYKAPKSRKQIFKNIYDVKRIQPGIIRSIRTLYDFDFKHDCATLRGNSGSPIIDLQTGGVVGIHFAASASTFEGYAVRVEVLREWLKVL